MYILNTAQRFILRDGKLQFSHTHVLFRLNGTIYCGQSPIRSPTQDIALNDIQHIQAIPIESYMPLLPPGCTTITDTTRTYIKKPNLMAFGNGLDLNRGILAEVQVGEALREKPHPNLAEYYGCTASEGRVSGLCFKKYPQKLMAKVNPGHLGKAPLLASKENQEARTQAARYLPGIEEGIRHLHSLGYIHNDLNPSNIMITEDDIPVVIDFDSATPPGAPLDQIKRTHGWFDPQVLVAQASNDLEAIEELRVWLCGSSAEQFRFKD